MSDLPQGWEEKELGALALLRRGITYSANMLVEKDAGLPYVNMKSFNKGGGFNKNGLKFFNGPYVKDDLAASEDLLIANTDVTLNGDIVGIPAYLPFYIRQNPVLFSHHVTRIKFSGNEVSSHYLYYLLNIDEYRRLMHKYARGTTVMMLDMTAIKRIPIRYPACKNVQKEIVKKLEVFDTTIEKTEALIHKYQQIKAGLMHDLFTRGLTADGKLRPPREQAPELYQETPIGWIPKEWDYELLDQLTERGSGHTPNRNIQTYWNGGVKWISLSDSRRLDKLYISDTDFEISQLGILNSSAVMQPAGIVVMSRDAGVGKSAITTESMAVSQHFMCWKCGSKMDNHYLYYWLQFKKRMFENIAMGSTIVTIGLPYFKRLRIAAPKNLVEQEELGKRLRAIDSYIFSMQENLAKLKKQKSGLMHDLLTGKVPVKIDQEEPAHG